MSYRATRVYLPDIQVQGCSLLKNCNGTAVCAVEEVGGFSFPGPQPST